MRKIVRVRTDWVHRYHVGIDAHAPVLDAYLVGYFTLPPVLVHDREHGKSQEDLWREALATLEWTRAQPLKLPHPPSVLIPFGEITVVSAQEQLDQIELQSLSIVSHIDDEEPWKPFDGPNCHMKRVNALCRMFDLLNGTAAPHAIAPRSSWSPRDDQ